MKKCKLAFFIVAFSVVGSIAYAQATAEQIQLGFLSTSGCSGSQQSCWLPYSAANPMPTVLSR